MPTLRHNRYAVAPDEGEYRSDDGEGDGGDDANGNGSDANGGGMADSRSEYENKPFIWKGDGLNIRLQVSSQDLKSVEFQKDHLTGSIGKKTTTFQAVLGFEVSKQETEDGGFVFKIMVENTSKKSRATKTIKIWQMPSTESHSAEQCLLKLRDWADENDFLFVDDTL
jgi:hypothetical protein